MHYVLLLLLGITAAYAKPTEDTPCNRLVMEMDKMAKEIASMKEVLLDLQDEIQEAQSKFVNIYILCMY